jgi:hypothetical protein
VATGLCAAASFGAGAAHAADTRKGIAEAEYVGTDLPALAAQFATACVERKWIVISPEAPVVTCEDREMSLLYQRVAAFSRRRIEARSLVRFTLIPLGKSVRVQAGIFTEETSLFGQTATREPETSADLTRILEDAKPEPSPSAAPSQQPEPQTAK